MSDKDFERAFNGTGRGTHAERVGHANTAPLANGAARASGPVPYRAYGYLSTGGISETCDVQRWLDGTQIHEGTEFQYRFLLRVAYVGDEQIRLFLPDSIIVINGRRLRDLRQKLARRQVTFILQHSPKVWPGPVAPNEPFIQTISILPLGN